MFSFCFPTSARDDFLDGDGRVGDGGFELGNGLGKIDAEDRSRMRVEVDLKALGGQRFEHRRKL